MRSNAGRIMALIAIGILPLGCRKSDSSAKILRGHSHGITALSFSPEGRFLASGDSHDEVCIWSIAELRAVRTFQAQQAKIPLAIGAVGLTKEGLVLASAFKGVQTWDVTKGERISNPAILRKAVRCLAFSPDGSVLAAAGEDQDIGIWKMGDGGSWSLLQGHKSTVLCLAFAEDGDRLVSGGEDQAIRVWNVRTGKPISSIATGTVIQELAFSKDGRAIFTWGRDHLIRGWDHEGGREIGTAQKATFIAGAFSPGASLFAGVSVGGRIMVMRVATGNSIHEYTLNNCIGPISLSADGTVAAGAADGIVAIFPGP